MSESTDQTPATPDGRTAGSPDHGGHGRTPPPRRPPANALPPRAMRVVVAALVLAVLPTFLVGALSAPIGEDLGTGPGAIGASVSVFFLTASMLALLGGRAVDRIGARRGYRIGMVGIGAAAAGIGLLATEGWHLIVGFCVGGASLAFTDPSIGRTIAGSVGWRRQGMGFGVKETAIPTASMAAGFTLPLLGPAIGWQVPFLVVAVLAVGLALVVPGDIEAIAGPPPAAAPSPSLRLSGDAGTASTEGARGRTGGGRTGSSPSKDDDPPDTPPGEPRALILLAISAGIGGGAGAAVATFIVPTGLLLGLGAAAAGALLSGASILNLGIRLGTGWLVDRHPKAVFDLLVALLAVGALGMVALALAGHAGPGPVDVDVAAGEVDLASTTAAAGPWAIALLILGAVLMIGPGWGWTGLVFLTATRLVPGKPAQASGAILTGLGAGGALFPIGAGWLAEAAGFGWTWTVVAVAMLLSAALMAVARLQAARRLART